MPLRWKAALTAAVLSLSGTGTAAAAQPARAQTPAPPPAARPAGTPPAAPGLHPGRVTDPGRMLPRDWRTSTDRAVTVSGDGSGLHVMVADSKDAYQWRTAATLSEPGITEDAWVGNACLTGSGRRAVVAYAPRTFADQADAFDRGAFAAVVDLDSGAVVKLPVTTTLAYFSPGCGAAETAVLTQENAKLGKTRLITVDAAKGTVLRRVTVAGQATSAVPVGDRVAAAVGSRLVSVDGKGHERTLTATSGPAFDLHADSTGALAFVDRAGTSSTAERFAGGRLTALATGPLGTVGIAPGGHGRLFLTGRGAKAAQLPATMGRFTADPGAVVSTGGRVAVLSAAPLTLAQRMARLGSVSDPAMSDPVSIAMVTASGAKLSFEAPTDDAPATAVRRGGALSPALGGGRPATGSGSKAATGSRTHAAGSRTPAAAPRPQATVGPHTALTADGASATDTTDGDRSCSIARNDPGTEVYQPTPNQVEWAVDDAVRGDLTSTAPVPVVRPANWKGSGLPAWSPQDVFPSEPLYGAGGQVLPGARVPAQVMLGVLAQESNLWQASGHDLPGQYGNPLVANFYGTKVSPSPGYQDSSWAIDWSKSDCGYGVAQVTDGMRLGDTLRTPDQQREIALDYATDIAAGLRILEDKWNELHRIPQPIKVNNDDPAALENWFAALWDYNEGFNPPSGSNPWGLGWANNPANPNYPANRHPFLDENTYSDAAHPQLWPYEEKVLGWAAWPIDTGNSYADTGAQNHGNTHGYQAAWWDSTADRTTVKPPLSAFCTTNNACDPASPPQCTDSTCYTAHWYTGAQTTWKACPTMCGNELITYKTLRTEPGDASGTVYPSTADCAVNKLPANAIIVDSLAGAPALAPCASGSRSWTSRGSLTFSFNDDGTGHYRGKEDLHQLSVGFGGHTWFAHTRNDTVGGGSIGNLDVTGTWTPAQALNGWTRVFVHIPASAATTQQASYDIHLGDGGMEQRVINTHLSQDTWVSLGVFPFSSNGPESPSVSLSNASDDGDGTADVAWDAAAFQPLPGKPSDIVVQMGDSYSSGEGAEPYLPGTDVGPYAVQSSNPHSPGETWNACRRSKNSWIRQAVLPRDTASIGSLADAWDPSLDYHSTACSGAFVSQVEGGEPSSYGQIGEYHEVSQLDSGFLDQYTTLVALTVGGNDAGFSTTLAACGDPTSGCPDDASVKAGIDGVDTGPNAPLSVLLREIHNSAPNAKIILLGYPELFGANTPGVCSVMGGDQARQLNTWADYMGTAEQNAVTALTAAGIPVTFNWSNSEFADYRICDGVHGINDLVSAPTGPGDFSCPDNPLCPSMESYHPNNSGTPRYAVALMNALAAAKY